MKRFYYLLLFFLFYGAAAWSQQDSFSGTWQMVYQPVGSTLPIKLELQIAVPEKNSLFPARLNISGPGYNMTYNLLLVKKNSRELAISRNKIPLNYQEKQLANDLFYFNGLLDQSKSGKGVPQLHLKRIQEGTVEMVSPTGKVHNGSAELQSIGNLLRREPISLSRISNVPLPAEIGDSLLNNRLPGYFGVKDSIYITSREVDLIIAGIKKPKNDMVSLALNGQLLLEQFIIGKKDHPEEILLDTGMNLLTFFSDNFGNQLPGRGKMQALFGGKKLPLDFADVADSAASFIVARLYVGSDKSKEKYFQAYTPSTPLPSLGDKDKLLGSILSTSRQLTFAIIDDAVEDGDSISIQINGEWITRGFPVKKYAQFITVTLQPGINNIVFIADNLGSIPPNTSVIEIIDGNKRKAFPLETIPGESNLIRIFYEVGPGG